MKLEYERSAARKGFQAEQVSRANVQQILNQGQQEAANLRAFADSDIRERKRQADALEENYLFESKQEADNYEILQRNLATKVEEAVKGGQQAMQAQSAMFNSFATLSSTAAKLYGETKTKQDEITKQNDINKYFYDVEYRKKVDAAMEGMTFENAAVQVEAASERDAAEVLSFNKVPVAEFTERANKLSIGQRIAYVKGQTADYPGYASKFFGDLDKKVEVDGKAYTVRDVLANQTLYNEVLTNIVRPGFLREKGLMGLSIEAMSPGLASMRNVESQLVTAVGNEQIAKIKQDGLSAAEAQLTTLTGSELVAALPTIVKNLNYYNGYDTSKTRKQFVELLSATDASSEPLITGADRELLLDAKIFTGANGKPFSLRDYKGDMSTISKNLRDAKNEEYRRLRMDAQREAFTWYQESGRPKLEAAVAEIESTSASPDEKAVRLQQLVVDLKKELRNVSGGFDVNPGDFASYTTSLLDESKQEKEAYQDERIEKREVDLDLINAEPDAERRKVLEAAYERQQVEKYGPQFQQVLEANSQRAKTLTGGTASGTQVDPKFKNQFTTLVQRQLDEDFRKEFIKYKNANPTASDGLAALKAGEVIDGWVTDATTGSGTGRYRRTLSGTNTVIGFPGLQLSGPPRKTGTDLTNYARNWTEEIEQSESLLTGVQLRQISKNFYSGGGFNTPQAVSDLTQRINQLKIDQPDAGIVVPTPQELINKQIDAYNETMPEGMKIRSLKPNKAEEFLKRNSSYTRDILSDFPNLSTMRSSRALSATPEGRYLLDTSGRLPEAQGSFTGKPLPATADVKGTEYWSKMTPKDRADHVLVLLSDPTRFGYNGFPQPGQPNRITFSVSYNSPKMLQDLNAFFGENAIKMGIKDVLYGIPGHMDSLTVTFE